MPRTAKIYISCVATAGLLGLSAAIYAIAAIDLPRFLGYSLLTIAAAMLKVRLPRITGTFSLGFIPVLAGIVQLSLPETVLIGSVASLAQCLWRAKEPPTLVQALFNVAALAISIMLADAAGQLVLGRRLPGEIAASLALAACVFFVANTLLTSGVISLMHMKPLHAVWRHWFLWSFPCYVVGALIAGLITMSDYYIGWKACLVFIPLAYLVYLYFRLYVEDRMSGALADQEPVSRVIFR